MVVYLHYPGLLYTDSFARWNFAKQIWNDGIFTKGGDWHPPVAALLLSPFSSSNDKIAFFTVLQSATLNLLPLFFLIDVKTKNWIKILLCSVLMLSPIWLINSVFHAYDVIGAISLSIIALTTVKPNLRFLDYLTFYASAFTLISFRPIAVMLLIFLPIARLVISRNLKSSGIFLILFALALCATSVVKHQMNLEKQYAFKLGFAWELVGMAKTASEQGRDYSNYIKLFKENFEPHKEKIDYRGIWGGTEVKGVKLVDTPVLGSYVGFAISEPAIFLMEKRKYISSALGIGPKMELINAEYSRFDHLSTMRQYGFEYSTFPQKIQTYWNWFVDSFAGKLLRRPWVVFLLLLIVYCFSVLARCSKQQGRAELLAFLIISLGYYSGYLITSHHHEFRYFLPSALLAILAILRFLASNLEISSTKPNVSSTLAAG